MGEMRAVRGVFGGVIPTMRTGAIIVIGDRVTEAPAGDDLIIKDSDKDNRKGIRISHKIN